MTKNLLKTPFLVLMLFILGKSIAQNEQEKNHIAASQAGGSSFFFYPNKLKNLVIEPSDFHHPAEFKMRDGLPYFFKKLEANKKVNIAYLGGSITRANKQYRVQSINYIQNMYPNATIVGMNAGVSGTGTDLGACRLYEQLLTHNPDLIFLEFAVNGAFAEGMEGIIRQIRKYDSKIDICLIYTITTKLTKIYAKGEIPIHIQKLDLLADHYALPSIHMGIEASYLEKQGKLIWKGKPALIKDKVLFSADGVHPLEAGGNLYAASIARAFHQFKKNTSIKSRFLPDPLLANNWEDAKMLNPKKIASFKGNWKTIQPSKSDDLKRFYGWFPYLIKASEPGSSFSFKFEGNAFGLFDIGGPEVGQLEIELDGKPLRFKKQRKATYIQSKDLTSDYLMNRFNKFCNNRYRGQYFVMKVNPGKHEVKIFISENKSDKINILGKNQLTDIHEFPEKYNKTEVLLGKILIKGKILK